MSKMGWIAQMIEDGSYEHFKQSYKDASKNNDKFFKFDGANCDITLGKHICKYVDNYLMEQHNLSKKYEELITKGF
jgi:hypothetical protein